MAEVSCKVKILQGWREAQMLWFSLQPLFHGAPSTPNSCLPSAVPITGVSSCFIPCSSLSLFSPSPEHQFVCLQLTVDYSAQKSKEDN